MNKELTQELGRSVLKPEVTPVTAGETLTIRFQSASGEWRQGIWLAVNGELALNGARGDQLEIWADTAPREFKVKVLRNEDGLLRLYNIWDSRRGRRRESQSATSGMLKEVGNGTTIYRANDIGHQPNFDKLVFELKRG
jgi:hypothetical protein